MAGLVSGAARTATLAVVRADGRPHAAPVWFVLDGGVVMFTTGGGTVKGQALQRDPRVALCVPTRRHRSPSSSIEPMLVRVTPTPPGRGGLRRPEAH
ncbi:MAG: pyridoxamine 5'-phosphate oxidase family protein [Acidimicrobiales bacterium]